MCSSDLCPEDTNTFDCPVPDYSWVTVVPWELDHWVVIKSDWHRDLGKQHSLGHNAAAWERICTPTPYAWVKPTKEPTVTPYPWVNPTEEPTYSPTQPPTFACSNVSGTYMYLAVSCH